MSKTDSIQQIEPARASSSASLSNAQIHARIFEAIVEQRLLPGTHLKEDALCALFGIGRTRIRAVLSRLVADHVIELVENRGAFVCRPTAEEAREVFRARRLVEDHLVRRAAESAGAGMRDALTTHLRQEQSARAAGGRGDVITRCGNYHLVLAEQARSPIMARFLRELVARSALVVAVYGVAPADRCEIEEHCALTELVLAGRGEAAAELMARHLDGIEGRLDLQRNEKPDDYLRHAFGEALIRA